MYLSFSSFASANNLEDKSIGTCINENPNNGMVLCETDKPRPRLIDRKGSDKKLIITYQSSPQEDAIYTIMEVVYLKNSNVLQVKRIYDFYYQKAYEFSDSKGEELPLPLGSSIDKTSFVSAIQDSMSSYGTLFHYYDDNDNPVESTGVDYIVPKQYRELNAVQYDKIFAKELAIGRKCCIKSPSYTCLKYSEPYR